VSHLGKLNKIKNISLYSKQKLLLMFFRELYGDILHNQHIPLNRDPLLEAHVGSSNTETQGRQRIQSFVVIFTSCHHSF
jgi:predicted FMN-binding regulatory protein PaiB